MINKLTNILSTDNGDNNEAVRAAIQQMINDDELSDVYEGLSGILNKC